MHKLYKDMWLNAVQRIEADKYEIDPNINSVDDRRRGLTVLSYLDQHTSENILNFLNELKLIEPQQYYYPANEFHLTVLSIITCNDQFQLQDFNIPQYIEYFKKTMREVPPLKIRYSGITASPSCVLVQGFPVDNGLDLIRDRLRAVFRDSGLQTSIDARYRISTAHSTVMRFKAPLCNPRKLITTLSKYREYEFGVAEVNNIEFVFNNWYQQLAVTKKLANSALL